MCDTYARDKGAKDQLNFSWYSFCITQPTWHVMDVVEMDMKLGNVATMLLLMYVMIIII